MEINEIIGAKLHSIHKERNSISMVFINTRSHKKYTMNFNGLIFETSSSPIGKVVQNVEMGFVTSFKVFSELSRQKLNPRSFQQMFISMRGSTEDLKIELVAACKDIIGKKYKLS